MEAMRFGSEGEARRDEVKSAVSEETCQSVAYETPELTKGL